MKKIENNKEKKFELDEYKKTKDIKAWIKKYWIKKYWKKKYWKRTQLLNKNIWMNM